MLDHTSSTTALPQHNTHARARSLDNDMCGAVRARPCFYFGRSGMCESHRAYIKYTHALARGVYSLAGLVSERQNVNFCECAHAQRGQLSAHAHAHARKRSNQLSRGMCACCVRRPRLSQARRRHRRRRGRRRNACRRPVGTGRHLYCVCVFVN